MGSQLRRKKKGGAHRMCPTSHTDSYATRWASFPITRSRQANSYHRRIIAPNPSITTQATIGSEYGDQRKFIEGEKREAARNEVVVESILEVDLQGMGSQFKGFSWTL